MIVTLSGVTGVGKSYFKKQIIEKLNFKNIVIVTTRAKREKEREGIDKYFITEEQFNKLVKSEEISMPFEFLGNKYAYYKKDLTQTDENSITEVHYDTIGTFKSIAKNVLSIYLKPVDMELARTQLKLRNLPQEVEKTRLEEMEEQAKEFEKNVELRKQFDYIIYNDYTEKTVQKVVKIIKNILEEEKKLCLKEG